LVRWWIVEFVDGATERAESDRGEEEETGEGGTMISEREDGF